MYMSYKLDKNEKLKYARTATKSQHKMTYFLTYGLINVCIMLLVLSFFFYYLSTPIVIDHFSIPPRDEFGIFLMTLFITCLLVLLAWRYKRQFSYLFQLALQQTNYAQVEIWADAKKIRFRLDNKNYAFSWRDVDIQSNNYQTYLSTHSTPTDSTHLLLIPNNQFASPNMIHNFLAWKKA